MKKKYEYKESYMHLYSKKLLLKWLRQLDETQDFCSFNQIHWRSNWGVHEELPFYETSDPYYFENSKGLSYYERCERENIDPRKCYDHLSLFDPKFNRGKLLFVPDITIFHKGAATILIEVVHTSFPSSEKLNAIDEFFYSRGTNSTLFVIEADHILKQLVGKNNQNKLYFEELIF